MIKTTVVLNFPAVSAIALEEIMSRDEECCCYYYESNAAITHAYHIAYDFTILVSTRVDFSFLPEQYQPTNTPWILCCVFRSIAEALCNQVNTSRALIGL